MSIFANNPIKLVIQRGTSMLESIAQTLEELMGQRGNPLNRVVTRGDLWQAGLVELRTTAGQVQAYAGVPHPVMVPTTGTGLDAYDQVFAPASLTVEATPSSIALLWDTPVTPRYAYTRVYRADTSDFSGATILGTGAGGFYVDALGAGGVTKYYWISHVDIDGIETGLNDAVGTPGTTGYVGNADIQDGTINGGKIVTNSIAANRIFAIDLAAINANVGVLNTGQLEVQTGGFIRSANYSAGSAGWQITNTNAEFNNVTVRGVLAGVTGTLGTLTIATGGYIQSSNYSAGTAGWKISDTTAEFNSATFRGALSAASGSLGTLTMASGGYIQSSNYVAGTSGWKLLETGIEFNTGLTVDYADITGTKPPADADNTADTIEAGTTITAGGITMSSGGSIKGGQTDYNTGIGWFLGYSGGEYKFSIGDPAGNRMTWDGVKLRVSGQAIKAEYAYTEGFTLVNSGAGTFVTVQSVTLTVEGSYVIVQCGCFVGANYSILRLTRDGSEIARFPANATCLSRTYGIDIQSNFNFTYKDTPSAGSHTYALQVTEQSDLAGVCVSNRYMSVTDYA